MKKKLVPVHPLSNIEITNSFNYEPTFNGDFSRNNLPWIKDEAYIINLDDKKIKKQIGFHCLLTEVRLNTLSLLVLSIFLKKC